MNNKKIIFILFVFFIAYINAQYTLIPDVNFEQTLISQGIDTEGVLDGQVLTLDIKNIEVLNISSQNIADITGIFDFTQLREFDCSFNNIMNIDLGNNIFVEKIVCGSNPLNYFDISNCINLIDLSIFATNLSGINLNANINLEILYCPLIRIDEGGDILPLTQFEITNCTKLRELYCWDNFLSELDLTNFNDLEILRAGNLDGLDIPNYGNNFISNFDFSNNLLLRVLGVENQGVGLTNLDISMLTSLKELYCELNINIENLDISNSTNLEILNCYDLSLTVLNLQNNIALKQLNIGSDILPTEFNNFSSLDLSNNVNLEVLHGYGTFLSGINLDLSNNVLLSQLELGYNNIRFLNIANGNNENLSFNISGGEDNCIQVDSEEIATIANADENSWVETDNYIYSFDCSTLDLRDDKIKSLEVFPNPIKDIFTINIDNNLIKEIRISDALGKRVMISYFNSIDISNLENGVFFVKLYTLTNKIFYKKIIKI